MRNFALFILITLFLAAPFTQAQSGRHGSKKHAATTPSASATPAPKNGASADSQSGTSLMIEVHVGDWKSHLAVYRAQADTDFFD